MTARDNRRRKRRATRRLEAARNVVVGVDIVRGPDHTVVTKAKLRRRKDGVLVLESVTRFDIDDGVVEFKLPGELNSIRIKGSIKP